ncbi:MAG TPA: DUF1345 domain-containing protein [Sphingomonadaceae bacterium]
MAQGISKWLEKLSHPRHLLFLAVLVIAPWPLSTFLNTGHTITVTFDLAALAFILSCIPLWHEGEADAIRRQAERDDVGQGLLLLMAGAISALVLGNLVLSIQRENNLDAVDIALLVLTLICSWTFANLSCAFHYARMYYTRRKGKDCGGLEFPGDEDPDFSDFVNFAFVIGMTCQTADIGITDHRVRRVSTFHGMFAFAYNLGVLALAVNVLASSSH